MRAGYLPIFIYSIIVLGLGASFIFFSHILGPKRRSKQKFEPYECGVDLLEQERKRFHVKFYLIATFFILFDIETVFLIPWAVNFKNMSMLAVIEMMVFIFILAIGLFYILEKKVLDMD